MTKTGSTIDIAAMALSAGCLAHCLMLPVAASALPLLGVAEEAEWVHWAFAAVAAPVSLIALRRIDAAPALAWAIRIAAAIGVGLLVVGATGWPTHDWETPLTVAGALVLASAHVVNFARRHARHHHHGEPA